MLPHPIHADMQVVASAVYTILASRSTPEPLRQALLICLRGLRKFIRPEQQREIEAAEAKAIIIAAAYITEDASTSETLGYAQELLDAVGVGSARLEHAAPQSSPPRVQRTAEGLRRRTRSRSNSHTERRGD